MKKSGLASALLPFGSFLKAQPTDGKSLRILILGGTGFLGPHQVRYALERGHMEGFARVDCTRALEKDLTFRALADTARDTLHWFKALPEKRRTKTRAGLDSEREAEVLAEWRKQLSR